MPEGSAEILGSMDDAAALAQARVLLESLDELLQRLDRPEGGDAELGRLERSTELVEEAGQILERLGRIKG